MIKPKDARNKKLVKYVWEGHSFSQTGKRFRIKKQVAFRIYHMSLRRYPELSTGQLASVTKKGV